MFLLQEQDEFRAFNMRVMASVIQGAIGEYLLTNTQLAAEVDLESYSAELVAIFDRLILRAD